MHQAYSDTSSRPLPVSLFAALSLVGWLALAGGCSSQDPMSDRRDRARAAMAAEPSETAAEGEGGETEGGELEGGEVVAPAEEPAAPEPPRQEPRQRRRAAPPADAEVAAGPEEEILRQMREESALRREEAEYHAQRGNELFSENRYDEAARAYRNALASDPTRDDVRRRLNDALILSGERSGEVAAVADDLKSRQLVETQERRESITRNLEAGRKALEANDVDQAERLVTQAVEDIRYIPDYPPAERTEAEDLLRRVRDEKAARDKARQEQMLAAARAEAQSEEAQASRVRYRQTQELLRKASEFMRVKEYEKAVEACERVLEIEPGNLVAKFWLADSKDQILRERRQKLIDDRLENQQLLDENFLESTIAYNERFVFPDHEQWSVAQRRARELALVNLDDPESVRRIKNALEGTRVDFNWVNTPLEDVVRQIRTFTGASIRIDPAVDAKTLQVSMKVDNLPASNALNLVLDNVGLTYRFEENVLFITNPGQESGGLNRFEIYNVSDILNKIRDFEGPELILKPAGEGTTAPISFTATTEEEGTQLEPDTLIQLVKDSTGGDEAWGEPKSIESHQRQLLVNAPRELHAEIQRVLENLRRDSDLFVVIEARFIDVSDDFLEDIGVDSRSLGLVNNWGTPFGNIINDNRTGGQDLGFTETGNVVEDTELIMGQDRWAGRAQHIIDGFTGLIRGTRLSGGQGIGGLTIQATWLEPFQINVIIRAVQERAEVRQLTAPIVTAHNGQRVYVSVITQRAYIADYNLVSGGTGFQIIEVADPEVQTFQEGVILDVDPVISHDKKYVTLDVRPTLATLINGVISTIRISLGSFTNVAFQVPIGVPEIALQQSFTSVTVPNGGTVLLGGFKSLDEAKYKSYVPIVGQIPIIENLFRRKATLSEKRSLVILLSVRIVDLRGEESRQFNPE
jgi:general secretion pathway protein D